jgi:hypothetical protein
LNWNQIAIYAAIDRNPAKKQIVLKSLREFNGIITPRKRKPGGVGRRAERNNAGH